LIYAVDVAPASFKGTRLELMSNAYQFYKFSKFVIKFSPSMSNVVNTQYLIYFDTDPTDYPDFTSLDDVLRIAKAHQGAKTVPINKPWTIALPISSKQKNYYVIPDKIDKRLSNQARLYIIQIANPTGFDGKPIAKDSQAGSLTLDWSVSFEAPQMNKIDRVFNGTSQKDIIRTFKRLTGYRPYTLTATYQNALTGVPFRTSVYTLTHGMFPSIGSYLVQKIPITSSLPNTLKYIKTFSPSSKEPLTMQIADTLALIAGGTLSISEAVKWVQDTWKEISGGLSLASVVFDVMSLVLPLFVSGTQTGAQTLVTYDASDSNHSQIVQGYNVIKYLGPDKPLPMIQEIFQFEDAAHANDAAVTVTYNCILMFYKLEEDDQYDYPSALIPPRKI